VTSREVSRRGKTVVTAAVLSLLALLASIAAAQNATGAPAPAPHPPVVMVLLDTHQARPGQRVPGLRVAATRTYVGALPANVRVGLITFDAHWKLLLPPTADRSQLRQALRSAQGNGPDSNGIYAAITGAESLLRHLGTSGRLVILSNAEDVISRPSFKPTVPIDVVPWHYDNDDNIVELRVLAAASRGQVAAPTSVPSLAQVFPRAAPPAPAPSRRAATPAIRATGPSWLLIGPLACVFLALLVIALRVLRPLTVRDPRRLADQIDRYGPRHAPSEPEAEGKAARAVLGWASSLLRSTNTERGLAERLDWAGISRTPAEWMLLTACGCVVLAGTLTVLIHNALLGVPVGVLAVWLAMRVYVSHKIRRRRNAFSEQLPDVLQLIAGSLQSGFSLPQALDAVIREDTQPAAAEFSRALAEARIGADLEDALQRVADRMDSTDLRWAVMAIRIQREVGGNLAEVLLTTMGTMRERAFLRRQVRALSAEGRLSAIILIALPILVGAWFFYSDPTYMRLLYTTVLGLIMFIGSAVLIVVGSLWMRKLIDIEV
jgi:Flp pilus assembly protein TadB